MGLIPALRDDRGEPCRRPGAIWHILGSARADLTRHETRRIEMGAFEGGRRGRPFLLALLAAAPFMCAWPILTPMLSQMGGAAIPFAMVMGAAGPLVFVTTLRTLGAERIARAYVAVGRCGSCAFPRAGLPVQPDGAVVCPECGAAWKANSGMGDRTPDPAHRAD